MYRPAGQPLQAANPVLSANCPTLQSSHTSVDRTENLPAGHGVHVDDPDSCSALVTEPAMHVIQSTAADPPKLSNLPLAHCTQLACDGRGWWRPTGQESQLVAVDAVRGVNRPAAQTLQSAWPERSWCCPNHYKMGAQFMVTVGRHTKNMNKSSLPWGHCSHWLLPMPLAKNPALH